MPKSEMALPANKGTSKPTFPIPDKAHALAAERLVGRALKASSITPAQAARVRAAARKKLGKSPTPKK